MLDPDCMPTSNEQHLSMLEDEIENYIIQKWDTTQSPARAEIGSFDFEMGGEVILICIPELNISIRNQLIQRFRNRGWTITLDILGLSATFTREQDRG